MTADVVWFDSAQAGAPVLNNVAGSLIGVLDACLISGFNTKTITALVVAGNVATATCNGHGYSGKASQDVLIAGATPAGLNGRKQPTVVDANTFRFPAPGVGNQTATGTITAKVAPLGWVKQFTGTNLAMYKRTEVTATAMMLRLSDAAGTSARATMVETATGINTFTGTAPTAGQLSGGQYWNKGPNDAVAKQWVLVGDAKRFYLFTNFDGFTYPYATISQERAVIHGFGDALSFKSGDAYHCFINGPLQDAVTQGGASNYGLIGSRAQAGAHASLCLARPSTQLGGSMMSGAVGFANAASGNSSDLPNFPSTVDGGLVLMPAMLLFEDNVTANYPYRAVVPGMLQVLAKHPFPHMTIIDPVVALPGRKVLMLSTENQGSDGQHAIDITGPWG